MKTIGLIGGMSWESTIPYYSIINEYVKEHLGGFHSAKIAMYSVDFAEIEECMSKDDWETGTKILAEAAKNLENMGADYILICTNTWHKVQPQIQAAVTVPVVHIADATAEALKKDGVKKVALLGTKFTMTENFYKDRLTNSGFDVVIPNDEDVAVVNDVIFNELCLGKIRDESRKAYSRIIENLKAEGAEAVILGCTEIGLLVDQKDSVLPVYDTTVIHATSAAELAVQ